MTVRRPLGLSVVLPAFNERDALPVAIERYLEVLGAFRGDDFELLVVDDGSNDGTEEIAARLQERSPRVRVVRHGVNRGQVAALRTGFAAARGEIVTHNGVDLPFAPEDTARAMAVLDEGVDGLDVLVIERVDRESYGLVRKVVSWGNVLAWRRLFGSPFHDHNFVQFYRRRVLAAIEPVSTAVNTVTPELILRSLTLGFQVRSLDMTYHRRELGKSSVRARTVVRAFVAVLKLWWRVRRGAWQPSTKP